MWKKLGLIAAALVVVVSACGDSGTDTTSADGTSSISAVAKEFEFIPDLWLVSAGDEVTIEYKNEGTIGHNWIVLTSEIGDEDEYDPSLALVEVNTEAGQTSSATFTAPAAGSYQVICNVAGHFGAGMVGQLTVSG